MTPISSPDEPTNAKNRGRGCAIETSRTLAASSSAASTLDPSPGSASRGVPPGARRCAARRGAPGRSSATPRSRSRPRGRVPPRVRRRGEATVRRTWRSSAAESRCRRARGPRAAGGARRPRAPQRARRPRPARSAGLSSSTHSTAASAQPTSANVCAPMSVHQYGSRSSSPSTPAIASAARSPVPIAMSQCGKRIGPKRAWGTTIRSPTAWTCSYPGTRSAESTSNGRPGVCPRQPGRRELRATGRGDDEVGGDVAEIASDGHVLPVTPELGDRRAALEARAGGGERIRAQTSGTGSWSRSSGRSSTSSTVTS